MTSVSRVEVVIAGGRYIDVSPAQMHSIVTHFFNNIPIKVIEGGQTGVDDSAKQYAQIYDIPFQTEKANWKYFGRAAGPIRNVRMANFGKELILIWDGQSSGSKSMKREMLKLGKPIHEVIVTKITKGYHCSLINENFRDNRYT